MNNLDSQYQRLLQDIIEFGVDKKDRTGTGTKSIFGYTIHHNMRNGFPLLTTKKVAFKTMATELMWFLMGDTNIKYLLENGCNIWNGDAYKNYVRVTSKEIEKNPELLSKEGYGLTEDGFVSYILNKPEFAKKWGELGPIYGKQWRSWTEFDYESIEHNEWYISESIDQIANLINDLKTNPDSRRLMVNAWNVGELDQMVLPPCHYGFQVYTRELSLDERTKLHPTPEMFYNINGTVISIDDSIENGFNITDEYKNWLHKQFDKGEIPKRAISLMWNQRSVDTFLGLPFNIASYGLLLEIIAKRVDMVPDELIGNLGDTHLYLNHIEQAKEQIGMELTDEERYNIWFNNNYETGMERYFDPNNLPDFDNENYKPTPKRTREPFELPTLKIEKTNEFWNTFDVSLFGHLDTNDFVVENYQSHPAIKAPLSN